MDFEVIDLGTQTPGQRMAARRTQIVRPGQPGFLEEELRQLVAVLESNPGIRAELGSDLQAVAGFNPVEGAFVLVVRRRPPAPAPRKRAARSKPAKAAV